MGVLCAENMPKIEVKNEKIHQFLKQLDLKYTLGHPFQLH